MSTRAAAFAVCGLLAIAVVPVALSASSGANSWAAAASMATARAHMTATPLADGRYLSWGATGQETHETLPGDELFAKADLVATRAITIRAPAEQVWPWIAQLGQRRGGFYSYDFLENLVGCNIHSADRIVPDWQHIRVGDEINSLPRSL